MKKFTPNAKCVKCGRNDVVFKYCAGHEYFFPYCRLHKSGEHQHRICRCCGYQWIETCLDNREDEK
ncbi:hypothetical protein LCGC14_0412030 [marine sediment metagenome]|uniref:Uncharacterized protein n=1 Tax=marine sediment metagenome TaxID=412755 RepID=A0A0F9FD91_9ZZZZ